MRWGWREVLIIVALVTATVAVYGRVARFDYINFDDGLYAADNRHIQEGLTSENLAWSWTTFHTGYWQPMTWMSLQLDVQLFGGQPGPLHLTNVLLHALNGVLLFLVLRAMTGATGLSAMVAGLFALHPQHVESVAWITERKDVLSTLFWLLATAAYVHYAQRPSLGRYVLVFVALLLGLLSKPMLVTLPFTLLLLDWWPLRRWGSAGEPGPPFVPASAGWLVVEKVPLFLLTAAFSGLTLFAQERGMAIVSFQELPLAVRVPHAIVSYGRYLQMTFWPQGLALFYPHPLQAPPVWQTVGAALALLAITALAFQQRRPQPYLLVGWLWFLGTLFPVSGVLQAGRQAMADRFVYVPHIGLFIMAVWGAARLLERWEVRRSVVLALGGAVLAACAVCAWQQVGYWRDSLTIWERTLQVTENNPVAHTNMGMALSKKAGNLGIALKHLNAALAIDPEFSSTHFAIGTLYSSLGRQEEAIQHYLEAIRIAPNHADAHNNLGSIRGQQGRLEESAHHFREALKGYPTAAPIYTNLGLTLYLRGQLDEAEACLQEALRLDPNYSVAHDALGIIRLQQGRLPEAATAFREAMERKPRSLDHDGNLAYTLRRLGREKEAESICARVRAADPSWATSASRRAWLMATNPEAGKRNGAGALRLAQQACEVVGHPGPELLDVLAAAQAETGDYDRAAATARKALEAPELPPELASGIRARLLKYQDRQPYRQSLTSSPPNAQPG